MICIGGKTGLFLNRRAKFGLNLRWKIIANLVEAAQFRSSRGSIAYGRAIYFCLMLAMPIQVGGLFLVSRQREGKYSSPLRERSWQKMALIVVIHVFQSDRTETFEQRVASMWQRQEFPIFI